MDEKKFCYLYPHPAVTTDCVVFATQEGCNDLFVLLIERKNDPFKGYWAFPGGFLNIDEESSEGAVRELEEETSIHLSPSQINQLKTFSAVNRDPRERVISIVYSALVNKENHRIKGGDDAAKAQWFKLSEVPPLAFDHKEILLYALKRIVTDFDSELCNISI